MARLFDGTNDSLQSASTLNLSAVSSLTLSFWLWWDSFADDDDTAIEFSANAFSNSGTFFVIPNGGSTNMEIGVHGNVGDNYKEYTRPAAATWHHFCQVMNFGASAANETLFYLNGTLQTEVATPGTSNNTGSFGNFTLNVMSRNNASLFAAGRLADLAIYPGATLNVSEIGALARGASPLLIRPTVTPHVWPLWGDHSPEINLRGGGVALTVNGAVKTGHAPVALDRFLEGFGRPQFIANAPAIGNPARRLLLGVG